LKDRAMSASASGKARNFAGWDLGNTIRVVMVAGMVWLTVEAPATTTLAAPYATVSLAAYYCAIASALFTPQFWARFGRPRRGDDATTILPGDRLFQLVTLLALLAATPQTLLWAVETPTSEPWSLGFYWFCVALFVLAAAVCLRNLLRSNDLLRLAAAGIAAPRLWQSVIPWSAIKSVRTVGTRSNDALMLTFHAPTPIALKKRPWLDWSVRPGTEQRSLQIPGIMLGMPAAAIAALVEARLAATGARQ
jgi:hypothetical protein